MNDMNEILQLSASDGDLSTKYLTFLIDGQHYGLSIANVIEIVQILPMTEMPDIPYYAKGIINLRGRVVPLIDVNLRFGKPEREYTDRTCIIIVDINGEHMGMIVDEVEEVLDIDGSLISPPPSFSAGSSSRYITGIGRLDKNTVLLLDSRLVFMDMDMSAFAQVAE